MRSSTSFNRRPCFSRTWPTSGPSAKSATLLAVAFLDIDDFKRFNSDYGETKVDRNLLTRFMQVLEAHVYHHGFAYRQGGKEVTDSAAKLVEVSGHWIGR